MIRLIATDLDDTLLNENSELTDRTMAALKSAMAAGCRIALSSGRMLESMVLFAERIGVNAPMLLYNGAMIYDHNTDETIYAPRIKYEVALKIAEIAERLGVYFQVYPGKGYFCNEKCEHTDFYEKSVKVIAQAVHKPMSQWMRENPGDVQKILIIDTVDGATHAMEVLKKEVASGACFFKSRAHYVEIVPENVDKGSSLKKLGEHLGIAREEIMAFGDGQNDVAMLEYAGHGYAMENACAEALACTDLIAPRNTEDGVAQVIERYLKEGNLGGK